jgi:uncharacterized protein (TIGR03435 family)
MWKSLAIVSALAACPAAFAQKPTFEVASVKPAAPCCAPGQWRESTAIADRIDFRYVTLKYCLAFAWRLKEYQISGPPWISDARYDIIAKGPAGTTREQLPEMVQALLAERFQLEFHREKKEFNVFVLSQTKGGHKLKPAPPQPEGAPAGSAFGTSMTNLVGKMECRHTDMIALANTLPRFVGKPVVNQTNIEGRYDFDLEFSPDDMKGIAPPPQVDAVRAGAEVGVSIFTSLQRVGLKLESQKLPLDTIVVDKGDKTPIEN